MSDPSHAAKPGPGSANNLGPGPHSGLFLLRSLRGIKPALDYCFMTGDPDAKLRDDLLADGALQVFHKPFDVMALATELRELMRQRDRGELQNSA
jgi:hypothetical protein